MPPSLPDELLLLVFEHFAQPSASQVGDAIEASRWSRDAHFNALHQSIDLRTSTLAGLCLASRNFHRLAWPILYRGYISRGYISTRLSSVHGADPARFLRTICLKPEYGLALQSLYIGAYDPIEAKEEVDQAKICRGDAMVTALFQWRARSLYLGITESLGFIYDEDDEPNSEYEDEHMRVRPSHSFCTLPGLLRALNLGVTDGHMTMLLLLCPNIQELDMKPPQQFDDSMFARVLNQLYSEIGGDFMAKPLPDPPANNFADESDYILNQMFKTRWPSQTQRKPQVLQSLHTLTVRCPGLGDSSSRLFKIFICLPSLRIMRVYGMDRWTDLRLKFWNFWGKRRFSIGLNVLVLDDCRIGTVELVDIVKHCPKLRKLAVSWKPFSDFAESVDWFMQKWCIKFGDIGRAIAQHCPRLKELKLDSSAGWPNLDAQPEHPYILGRSLKEMGGNLYALSLDEHSVYGSEFGDFGYTLGETVPKHIALLELISYARMDHRDSNHLVEDFHKWQDDDLNAFLADTSFYRLGCIKIRGRVRWQNEAVARMHGWEIVYHRTDTGVVSQTFISRTRLEQHGFGSQAGYFDADSAFTAR